MDIEEYQLYYQKIDEIGEKVYELYNMWNRDDLIMVYEIEENIIYSYIYDKFKEGLNERSRKTLAKQYRAAKESNKIVLFISDKLRKKFMSFTI